MVEIIEIAPVDPPKPLTAQIHSSTLHDHFLGFLNSNNPNGFIVDDISFIDKDTIASLLLEVAQNDRVSEDRFKWLAKTVKRQSGGVIKHSRALDIISSVFGYNSWYEVKTYRINCKGMIENRRNRNKINLKLFM